uniref:Uncharacterized protein n=1 Tax=Malurus cyaneus samueli TaxID=2593467 RepID=A0A8C5X0M9_9PASS
MSRIGHGSKPGITDSFRGPAGPGAPGSSRQEGKEGQKKGQGQGKNRADWPPPPLAPPGPGRSGDAAAFELSWEFGPPPVRITRLQRWERAQELGLSPPGSIRDALLEHRDNPDVLCALWGGRGARGGSKKRAMQGVQSQSLMPPNWDAG